MSAGSNLPPGQGTITVVVSVVTDGRGGVDPNPKFGSGATSRKPPRSVPRQVPEIAVMAPPEERLKRIVSYAKTYHYPNVPEEKLREVLGRGNGRFIDIARSQKDPLEQEYLLDSE